MAKDIYETFKRNKLEMTIAEEIELFKKTKLIIQAGYGNQVCKELHFGCAGCQAQMMIAWINQHLDLLEWSEKHER